jgi:hypothetical protein
VLDSARQSALKEGQDPDEAVLDRYHSRYAAPFCLLAARQFFTAAPR